MPTPTVDLSVDTANEESEATSGGWVVVNEGYDEDNVDSKGHGLWDIYPDATAGDRINADDEELTDSSLALRGSGKGTWSLTFPTKIKVWKESSGGSYTQVQSGVESESVDLPLMLTLRIEGISASEHENDVSLNASLTPEGGGAAVADSVVLTVLASSMQSELTEGSKYQDDPDAPPPGLRQSFSMTRAMSVETEDEPPASPGIENFPPLITYNEDARRTLTAVDLPTRLAGQSVDWEVMGPGEISNDGSTFSSTMTRPVYGSDQSVVIFRATAPGRIRIALHDPSTGNLVAPRKQTVAFTINQLFETDHQVNHIPNNKWQNTHNYLTITEPANRLKMKNTLFYCQEPENSRIELRLSSTFLSSSGKTTWWRFAGQERNAGGEAQGYYEYRGKFVTSTTGVADLKFWPRNLAYLGVSSSYASGLYTLSIGADSNGDGKPDQWVYPSAIPYRLQHVSLNERGRDMVTIISAYYNMPGYPMVGTMLQVFMEGPTATGSLYTVPAPTKKSVAASYSSLTHIAGAHFGGANASVMINRYTWGSQASERIHESLGLREYVARIVNANRQAIITAFNAGGSPQKTFRFVINPSRLANDGTSNTVGDLQWDKSSHTHLVDYDCFASLGGVSINNGVVRIAVVKQTDGTLKASRVVVNGFIEDLNDYDYYGASINIPFYGKEPVSRNAASVQIGWENAQPDRTQGNIFYNKVVLNHLFTRGDGYEFLEYVSENAIENINLAR